MSQVECTDPVPDQVDRTALRRVRAGGLLRRTFIIAPVPVGVGLITSSAIELFFRYRESAEVRLAYIRDVIAQVAVGQAEYACVVSGEGDLIAHLDLSMVLQKRNLKHFSQVQMVLYGTPGLFVAQPNLAGQQVFAAYAPIPRASASSRRWRSWNTPNLRANPRSKDSVNLCLCSTWWG